MTRHHKQERHQALLEEIEKNPFSTDEELAKHFSVSVSTIRLDRTDLGIPELRERTRAVAHEAYGTLKSLEEQEVIGRLMELKVGDFGRSEMLIEENMVLDKARVARGHHLFAQANSLAIALVDAEMAVTGSVELKFLRPAHLGQTVITQGRVLKRKGNKYWVDIVAQVEQEDVLTGHWILFGFDAEINL
ncbi:transcription factor FapR [Desulfitobacterium metallireducens]|uniref:DeoR family transcriptional regulator n=1 Tax=Desulfitobacterium metallireducens DSM 15288 TaxID=871968 RepID=W0E9S3_9FIRM|nr:transcription factor FapR [Desulfitobacterium metallireducens]AHF07615.1 DeoR family transcriptional regulator [Desulfitobacterium metallireducens DSM 15288]